MVNQRTGNVLVDSHRSICCVIDGTARTQRHRKGEQFHCFIKVDTEQMVQVRQLFQTDYRKYCLNKTLVQSCPSLRFIEVTYWRAENACFVKVKRDCNATDCT